MGNISKDNNLAVKEKSRQRDIVLDMAKGILIILMVAGHSGAPKWLESCIYSFHMPCFFMISGMLFSYFYLDKPKAYIKKRIKGIWWPFVKWTWIFLIFHNLFYNFGVYNEPLTFQEMVKKFVGIFFLMDVEQLLGGFWFLRSLFIAAVVCFLYYKFIGIKKGILAIGIAFFVGIAELLTVLKFQFYYFEPVNILACAYFMAGTLLAGIQIRSTKLKWFVSCTALILLGCAPMYGKLEISTLNEVNMVPYFIQSLIISSGFLFMLNNFRYTGAAKYLAYIGEKTIDILIFHFLAFRIVSLIKIYAFGLDMEKLKDFPVIPEYNSVFWIIYVILALIICLSYSKVKEYLQMKFVIYRQGKRKIKVL